MWKNLLFATVVFVVTLIVLPVQAGEVSQGGQVVAITSPCSNCEQTVVTAMPVLPQGETEKIQPIEDHTWGGDPDEDQYASGWLDIVMCLVYWDESCRHLTWVKTVWF